MNLSIRKGPALAGAALAAALLLSSCSGSTPESGTPISDGGGGSETLEVTVSVVKVAGSAPVYIADQQGFFEEAGLDVTVKELPGPAAVAALQNGEVQFSSLGAAVVAQAVANNVPITVVSGRTETAIEDAEDETGFMVMPDSGIETAADMAGVEIASQTLTSQSTLMARSTIDALGGDADGMQWVDIAFPDMMGALRSGSIKIAAASEPTVTQMIEQGAVRLFGTAYAAFGGISAPIGVIGTTDAYADANPEAVQRFAEAMDKAIAWANEDGQRLRDLLPDLVGLKPEVAQVMTLPTFSATVSQEGMEALVAALVDQGLLQEAPALDRLIP